MGQCIDYVGSYWCSCDENATGENCEQLVEPCASNPCVTHFEGNLSIDQYSSIASNQKSHCTNIHYQPFPDTNSVYNQIADKKPEYECHCQIGFTGTNCEIRINECVSNPCGENGNCYDLEQKPGQFQCSCLHGFEGELCNQARNPCQSWPCQNNGFCNIITSLIFTCECPPEFYGPLCQYEKDFCESDPCLNKGICLGRKGECLCMKGFTGRSCEINLNECNSQPCGNHGECIDQFGLFLCECEPGFTGTFCNKNINDCQSNPCSLYGKCEDGVNFYRCLCDLGFTGKLCEIELDYCQSRPCKNDATCKNLPNGYKCECSAEYYGVTCANKLNVCQQIDCRNGQCIENEELQEKFECLCETGYRGKFCEFDIPECASNPCENFSFCFEPNPGKFECRCLPGFEGARCEIDIDDCTPNPCKFSNVNFKDTCRDKPNGYECICGLGFFGKNCQYEADECSSDPCLNGKCIDHINAYTCECDFPYLEYNNCRSIKNFCVDEGSFQNTCQNGANCRQGLSEITELTGEFFKCNCADGFQGKYCQKDVDECQSSPCKNDGICHNHVGYFTCECTYPFGGQYCEQNIDVCNSVPCVNSGTCNSIAADKFTCTCQAGRTGNQCEYDIDECSSYPCAFESTCENLKNGYICHCHPHFTGPHCETRIDFCHLPGQSNQNSLEKYGYCQPGTSRCINIYQETQRVNAEFGPTNGYHQPYECLCSMGWTGKWCNSLENLNKYCASQPCLNNGVCSFSMDSNFDYRALAQNLGKYYTTISCLCPETHSGKYCQNKKTFCQENNPECGKGTCLSDNIYDYQCDCPEEYVDAHCLLSKIEDCIDNSPNCLHGSCSPFTNTCICNSRKWKGVNCNIQNLACASNPCFPNGRCIEDHVEDIYTCNCNRGWHGTNCQHQIKHCASRPCLNNSPCIDYLDSYACVCDPSKFIGTHCETDLVQQLTLNCDPPCHANYGSCNLVTKKCDCVEFKFGADCSLDEPVDYCISSPCENNGQCVMNRLQELRFECMCPIGYSGDFSGGPRSKLN